MEKWREEEDGLRRSEERDPKPEKQSLREVPRNGFDERDDAIKASAEEEEKEAGEEENLVGKNGIGKSVRYREEEEDEEAPTHLTNHQVDPPVFIFLFFFGSLVLWICVVGLCYCCGRWLLTDLSDFGC